MRKMALLLVLGVAGMALAQEATHTIAETQYVGAFGPDSSAMCGQTVILEGLALSSEGQFYAGSHSTFYMTDAEGSDWGAILVFGTTGEAFDVLVGDSVRVTGTISEYHTTGDLGNTSEMTEIVVSDPGNDLVVINYENPMPDPVEADMWELDPVRHDTHVAEHLEARLVQILGAYVVDISAPSSYRQFTVANDEGDETVIRTAATDFNDVGRPPLGATYEMIRGVVYQVYGQYNVMPRYIDDLVIAVGPPIISGGEIGPCGATPADLLTVSTNISDNTAVDEAFVYFRVNGGNWSQYDLQRDAENPILFTTEIPAQAEGSLLEYYIEAVDDDGETSYSPADGVNSAEFPQFFVSGVSVTDVATIQENHYSDGSTYYNCHEATLTGVITMGYDDFGYDSTRTSLSYYFADAAGEYSGILIYNNQSHDVWMEGVQSGDNITITGEVTEYNNITELSYISAMTVNSTGNATPSVDLSLADFAGDEEPYESVLVRLSDVTWTEDVGYGEWRATDASGNTIVVDNSGIWEQEIAVGAHADHLTGVITYNYGAWKIEPRTNDDFDNFTDLAPQVQPAKFELHANYPNPFNPTTTLSFSLTRAGEVSLVVYNVLGEQVAVLQQGTLNAGEHQLNWNASALASGVYFARLSAFGATADQKMLLIK